MLKISKIADIRYRIINLRAEIKHLVDDEYNHEDWERGYRHGRLTQMESELRFLEGLVK